MLEVVISALGTGQPRVEVFNPNLNKVTICISAESEQHIILVVLGQGNIGCIRIVNSLILFHPSLGDNILSIPEGFCIIGRSSEVKGVAVVAAATKCIVTAPNRENRLFSVNFHLLDHSLAVRSKIICKDMIVCPCKTPVQGIANLEMVNGGLLTSNMKNQHSVFPFNDISLRTAAFRAVFGGIGDLSFAVLPSLTGIRCVCNAASKAADVVILGA